MIKILKEKLDNTNQSNSEEIELLKVKMAQLHNGDIEGLIKSYEEQIGGLAEIVSDLEEVVK